MLFFFKKFRNNLKVKLVSELIDVRDKNWFQYIKKRYIIILSFM